MKTSTTSSKVESTHAQLFRECEAVLEERGQEYPPFAQNMKAIVEVIRVIHPELKEFSAIHLTTVMVVMKLTREGQKHKRDNVVDAINYLTMYEELNR